jgi:hypothetical protein
LRRFHNFGDGLKNFSGVIAQHSLIKLLSRQYGAGERFPLFKNLFEIGENKLR